MGDLVFPGSLDLAPGKELELAKTVVPSESSTNYQTFRTGEQNHAFDSSECHRSE
jgi:hypothetical protein